MTDGDKIQAYLHGSRDDMLDLLARLVLAESPSRQPEAQVGPLTILWETLTDLGFAVQQITGRATGGHLLARLNTHPAEYLGSQLLVGHCDTVWPMGTLKVMPLEIGPGVVKGPGVYDMKGGLTQMIFALRALRELDCRLPLQPIVFINSDEEIGSIESRPYICELAQEASRAFILEPALEPGGKLKTARKGVGRFEVVVKGRAAHAGLDPESGRSAILALSYVIQQLHALNDPQAGVTVNVGLVDGGVGANVVPPVSKAIVDVRVRTQHDAALMEERLQQLTTPVPDTTVTVAGAFGRPPLERTAANRALWELARQVGRQIGLELEAGTAGGGSDGNYTSLYTATLDGLGAVGDGAHAAHEFLYIDKMIERTALLALLLLH